MDQGQHANFAIGKIRAALAIAAIQRRPDARDLIDRLHHTRLRKTIGKIITLGIDIRCDVMRYLTGILTESHALVEGCGTEPHGPLFYARIEHLPQTNMMSLLCTAANG